MLTHEDWNLYIAAIPDGVCYVGSPDKPLEELTLWAGSRFPGSPLVEDDEVLQPYATELLLTFGGLCFR